MSNRPRRTSEYAVVFLLVFSDKPRAQLGTRSLIADRPKILYGPAHIWAKNGVIPSHLSNELFHKTQPLVSLNERDA